MLSDSQNFLSTFYIVGGGPSLLNYDWGKLRDKRVIAVNRAFEVLPWAEIVYFTDHQFFEKYKDRGLLEHNGALCSISKRIHHPRVIIFEDTGEVGLDTTPGALRNGKNSGYAAINLAVQLKATTIILLGMDMTCQNCDVVTINGRPVKKLTGRTHWHSGYNRNYNQQVYDKMLRCFPTLVKPLKDLNITVLNASPTSKIECFPKIPLEDAHLDNLKSTEEPV